MVGVEVMGLGLIGFSSNCVMVVLNAIGIKEKDPEKLAPGWGLSHLALGTMMVITGVSTYVLNPVGVAAVSGYVGIALAYYGFFWIFLGGTLIRGLDLRPIAQVSIAYAIVDLWFIWGALQLKLYSLVVLLVVLTVVFILLWPATHGRGWALRAAAGLLVILALLGFYLAFAFVYPNPGIYAPQ